MYTKAKQIQKVECLKAKQNLVPELDQDKAVKNFHSRSITEKEKETLALGLNVAVTPKHIPTFEIIAGTEATANSTPRQHNFSYTGGQTPKETFLTSSVEYTKQ